MHPPAVGRRSSCAILGAAVLAGALLLADTARAASAAELESKANTALQQLLGSNDQAHALADEARAILVFPNIVKGGFIFGGQYGDGALREGGHTPCSSTRRG